MGPVLGPQNYTVNRVDSQRMERGDFFFRIKVKVREKKTNDGMS